MRLNRSGADDSDDAIPIVSGKQQCWRPDFVTRPARRYRPVRKFADGPKRNHTTDFGPGADPPCNITKLKEAR